MQNVAAVVIELENAALVAELDVFEVEFVALLAVVVAAVVAVVAGACVVAAGVAAE